MTQRDESEDVGNMKPVFQTIIGENGNCFAACVASILEIDLSNIPAFRFFDEWPAWLHPQGWGMRTRSLRNVPLPDGYCILDGSSPRGFKDGHAVVALDGKIVHDPYPGWGGPSLGDWWRHSVLYRLDDAG